MCSYRRQAGPHQQKQVQQLVGLPSIFLVSPKHADPTSTVVGALIERLGGPIIPNIHCSSHGHAGQNCHPRMGRCTFFDPANMKLCFASETGHQNPLTQSVCVCVCARTSNPPASAAVGQLGRRRWPSKTLDWASSGDEDKGDADDVVVMVTMVTRMTRMMMMMMMTTMTMTRREEDDDDDDDCCHQPCDYSITRTNFATRSSSR